MTPQTFDTAPTDRQILAYHKVWRCWITISYSPEAEHLWLDGTFVASWPTAAFTHWMECPSKPEGARDTNET